MNIDNLKEFISLRGAKSELEAELKLIKKKISALESKLLDDFDNDGVHSMKIENTAGRNVTVYINRQLWASPEDGYEKACSALRAAGLDEYVHERFNVNSLSSYVRELDEEEAPLPEEFEGAISVTEKYSLRTRNA